MPAAHRQAVLSGGTATAGGGASQGGEGPRRVSRKGPDNSTGRHEEHRAGPRYWVFISRAAPMAFYPPSLPPRQPEAVQVSGGAQVDPPVRDGRGRVGVFPEVAPG